MNKIIRLCAAGLLAFAVYGCDSSDSQSASSEETPEDVLTDPKEDDSQDNPQTDDSQDNPQKDSKDSSQVDPEKGSTTEPEDKPQEGSQGGSTEIASIDPDSNQSETIKELEVVIRDFDASYPDFQNYQSAAYESQMLWENFNTWNYPGYGDNEEWLSRRSIPGGYSTYGCGNATTPEYGIPLGVQGLPHDLAAPNGATSTTPEYIRNLTDPSGYAWFGEYANCTGLSPNLSMRGFASDLCSDDAGGWVLSSDVAESARRCSKSCNAYLWAEQVYITPGMVEQKLLFPVGEDGKPNLREPVIKKAREACDNKYFEQWFADNDANKRSEGKLALSAVGDGMGIHKNWNNGGFYPLDVLDEASDYKFVSVNTEFENQYGPQSLNIYCPPYEYIYASTQTDFMGQNTNSLCGYWLALGGPRVGKAAVDAAGTVGNIGIRHLRNSGFTMMGYAPFKYKKGEKKVLEFASIADMWVFVDGVLALDLGGSHLTVNGHIDLDLLAENSHGCHSGEPLEAYCDGRVDETGAWKDGSWHHLHIFYADRSADASELFLKF